MCNGNFITYFFLLFAFIIVLVTICIFYSIKKDGKCSKSKLDEMVAMRKKFIDIFSKINK